MTGVGDTLAGVNATLNGLSAVLIGSGYVAIKRHARNLHRIFMMSAFVVSAIFLCCYLTRVAISGTHRYPGSGAWKAIYLSILITHMILAVATPPLVIRSLYLASKQRFVEHKRLVRYTLPIWMYVSVTGVLVYLLLYHPPG